MEILTEEEQIKMDYSSIYIFSAQVKWYFFSLGWLFPVISIAWFGRNRLTSKSKSKGKFTAISLCAIDRWKFKRILRTYTGREDILLFLGLLCPCEPMNVQNNDSFLRRRFSKARGLSGPSKGISRRLQLESSWLRRFKHAHANSPSSTRSWF